MNKSELIQQLAARTAFTRVEASKIVDALFNVEDGIIADALGKQEKVQIAGFGSFEARPREARKGRNPRTGREIVIAASTTTAFRVGRPLKESLGVFSDDSDESRLAPPQRMRGPRKPSGGRGPKPGRS